MALERKNRVQDSTDTLGTGTVDLNVSSPDAGYRPFAGVVTSGATVRYLIISSDATEWEVGQGVYTNAATDTLSRATIYNSSNGDAAVDFSAGTKKVYLMFTAEDLAEFMPLAGGTLTGEILHGENSAIRLDDALSADGKYCGKIEAGIAGAALVFGNLCYFNDNDSRWELFDANLSDGYDKKLGMCVLAAEADGDATKMLLWGKIRADSLFPALTIGAPVYGGETAGAIVTAQPTTSDACIRVIGFGNTADELFFNPSGDYMVHI